jgi:hypothetical protein
MAARPSSNEPPDRHRGRRQRRKLHRPRRRLHLRALPSSRRRSDGPR